MKKLIRTLAITLCLALTITGWTYANDHHNHLVSRTEQERTEILAVALLVNGVTTCYPEKCFFQGLDSEGNAWWNVKCYECEDAYCIEIKDDEDGTISVYDCKNLGGKCFKKLQ